MTQPAKLPVSLPAAAGPSFRGALADRDFSLLFVGQLGSEIGNGLIQLALPWLVLRLTGSAFQLGAAYVFQFLPTLLFGIPAGVLSDRWDRRVTMVIVEVVRSSAFLSVGVIYYLGHLTVEHVYAVIFLESTMATLFNPARAALMPNLVKPENLRAANSIMELTRSAGALVAPTIGALFIALMGPAAVMLMNGVSFLISATTIFFIKWRSGPRERVQSEGVWHALQIMLNQTAEGMGVIARERLLQVAVLLGLALNVFVAPINVLLPIFVQDIKHADARYYGLLAAAMLSGVVIGSLLQPQASRRFGLGSLTIASVMLIGGLIAVASWPPTLWPPLAAIFLSGLAIGALNVTQTTMLQNATSNEDRGRVSGTYFTVTTGAKPLAFLLVGALASGIDVRFMFVVLGLATFLVGASLVRVRVVRELR